MVDAVYTAAVWVKCCLLHPILFRRPFYFPELQWLDRRDVQRKNALSLVIQPSHNILIVELCVAHSSHYSIRGIINQDCWRTVTGFSLRTQSTLIARRSDGDRSAIHQRLGFHDPPENVHGLCIPLVFHTLQPPDLR
jgi:hypothetical protein